MASFLLFAYHLSQNPFRYWILLTGFSLSFHVIYWSVFRRVLLILTSGTVLALGMYVLDSLPMMYANVGLILFSAGLAYIRACYSKLLYSTTIINFLLILSCYFSPHIDSPIKKIEFVLISTVIVAGLQILSFKNHTAQFKYQCSQILGQFRQLSADMFDYFLQINKDNAYLLEKRIHTQKKYLLKNLQKFKIEIKKTGNQFYFSVLLQFNKLFDTSMNYAHFRQRLSNYIDLAFCRREIESVAKEIDQFFFILMNAKKKQYNFKLEEKIQELETIYQQVVVVTTRDPIIFLLFILALKNLNQELMVLYEVLQC